MARYHHEQLIETMTECEMLQGHRQDTECKRLVERITECERRREHNQTGVFKMLAESDQMLATNFQQFMR